MADEMIQRDVTISIKVEPQEPELSLAEKVRAMDALLRMLCQGPAEAHAVAGLWEAWAFQTMAHDPHKWRRMFHDLAEVSHKLALDLIARGDLPKRGEAIEFEEPTDDTKH